MGTEVGGELVKPPVTYNLTPLDRLTKLASNPLRRAYRYKKVCVRVYWWDQLCKGMKVTINFHKGIKVTTIEPIVSSIPIVLE